MVSFRVRLGSEVARLREKKHWSQQNLADEAALSKTTVQNLEYAWSHISLRNFAKICKALEVVITDLLIKVGTEDAADD